MRNLFTSLLFGELLIVLLCYPTYIYSENVTIAEPTSLELVAPRDGLEGTSPAVSGVENIPPTNNSESEVVTELPATASPTSSPTLPPTSPPISSTVSSPTSSPTSSPSPMPTYQTWGGYEVAVKDTLFDMRYVSSKMDAAQKELFQLKLEKFLLENLPPFQENKKTTRFTLSKIRIIIDSQMLRERFRPSSRRNLLGKGMRNLKELLLKLDMSAEYEAQSPDEPISPPTDDDFKSAVRNLFSVDHGDDVFILSYLLHNSTTMYFKNVTNFEKVKEVPDTKENDVTLPKKKDSDLIWFSVLIGGSVAVVVFVAGFAIRDYLESNSRKTSIVVDDDSSTATIGSMKKGKPQKEKKSAGTNLTISGNTCPESEIESHFTDVEKDSKSSKSESQSMRTYNTSDGNAVRNISRFLDFVDKDNVCSHGRKEFYTCEAPPGSLGVGLKTVNGFPVVSKLKPGSPLAKTLRPNDIIIAIDDVETSRLPASAVTNIMSSRRHSTRKITYGRSIEESEE